MLISLEQFAQKDEYIWSLPKGTPVGIDFETNGLSVRAGARAFILGFALRNGLGERESYSVLTHDPAIIPIMRRFVGAPHIRYLAHNAKFEMGFLRHQFKAEIGPIWDTEVFARVQRNNHMKYDLQSCAKRIGMSKHQPMLDWIKANKRAGKMHHDAPMELTIPYVEQDAWLEIPIYEDQYQTFKNWELHSNPENPKISNIIHLELATTKNLFEIEDAGLDLDVEYCKKAKLYEESQAERCLKEFRTLTGQDLVSSAKCLQPIFDKHGIAYGKTEKGAPSFTEETLKESAEHPITRSIIQSRKHLKRANTYWENFLKFNINGKIHPNIRQCGAKSFRMSVTEPAAQTWTDDGDDEKYPIRRAFTCAEDEYIVSIDYSQMELRKMVDEAEDHNMADGIKSGRDLHQEVADDAQVPRGPAKNGRFAKLYGAGVPRIAETLGVSLDVARRISKALDAQSPRIAQYCRELIDYAQRSPFGFNWLGRRYYFERGFEYTYANYRIQGGCSEILRIATDDVMKLLKGTKSRVIMLIHDEIVLRMHKSDLHLIPEIKRLMIAADRSTKILAMDVSVAIGKNLFDMEKYDPTKQYA